MIRRFIRQRRENACGLDHAFHETQSVFVHIPKTAGTSVAKALYGHQIWHWTIHEFDRDKRGLDYFRFTFVREPLDRMLSAFRQFQSLDRQDRALAFAERYVTGDFAAFVERAGNSPDILRHTHFMPQWRYVASGRDYPERLLVNFVGRFEAITEDFAKVCKRINVKTCLPHEMKGGTKPDISDETRQKVREIYNEDYNFFLYG